MLTSAAVAPALAAPAFGVDARAVDLTPGDVDVPPAARGPADDRRDRGGEPLEDVLAIADAAIDLGAVDGGRMWSADRSDGGATVHWLDGELGGPPFDLPED